MGRNEYSLLERCHKHPNVVGYKDNFQLESKMLIIMEFCEGGDLGNFIREAMEKRYNDSDIQRVPQISISPI